MTGNQVAEKHKCKTYIVIWPECDMEKCRAYFRKGEDFSPEDVGISNKKEIEKYIIDEFGIVPIWEMHHFIIGYNDNYDVDVNNMIRVTLNALLGKEEKLKQMKERFSVHIILEIVPYIIYRSRESNQILSLEKDIISFLYETNVEMDIDYYVI